MSSSAVQNPQVHSAQLLSQAMFTMAKQRRRIVVASLTALCLIAAALAWWTTSERVDIPRGIMAAKNALLRRQYEKALAECNSLLKADPHLSEVLIVKGECLQRLGRTDDAMTVYAQIENDGSTNAVAARLTEASVFLQRGEITKCLLTLDQAESVSPDSPVLISLKASALTASGRRWESMPYLRRSLDAGVGDTQANLIYLAVPDQMPRPDESYLAKVVQNKDTLGAIGAARISMALGFGDRAESFLLRSQASHPDVQEVYIQYATLLLNANRTEAFLATIFPESVSLESHPEYWVLLGRYFQETGHSDVAIRCYWEVLRRHPDQDRACYQLGQLLASDQHLEESRLFIERAGRLAQLVEKASLLYDHPNDKSAMATCAEITYQLGRYRESRHWCELLLMERPPDDVLARVRRTLELLQQETDVWQDDKLNVAEHVNLDRYPLPDFSRLRQLNIDTTAIGDQDNGFVSSGSAAVEGSLRFSNDAEAARLQFVYRNGSDSATEGRRMFEYTGGGVAVLDLDHDGHEDVHMTQGTDWPPDSTQTAYLDQTFRNIRGIEFVNTSDVTGVGDAGFSQGSSAGDFDNDGFSDLYVGNIAGNTLYRNNGDGTFTDVTPTAGIGHQHWTTSCAIVDLNGDSLPDLYDVTFLQGVDIFTKICEGEDGIPRSCAPAAFEAAPDFVWENQGDGTFRPFPAASGFNVPDGDGLGIVVSDFDQSGRLSIFIANDGRANFFFVPQSTTSSQLTWEEVGIVNGTAFDATGRAQACMGVAASDFDKNGSLDLFVTNFFQEANTLYVNMGANTFLDQSKRFGLHDPSYGYLGFGTQFLDADLDTWQDLVVTNGHVDDFRHKNIPYRMKPQLFQNKNGNRFPEIAQNSIGPYFDSEHMGRGMAILDWNRDFLTDVVISQLDEPSALLTNKTMPVGKGTGLRLVDNKADRDAIGSRIVVESVNGASTYFLNAGDGYQSSNTKELILATVADEEAFSLRIFWKSGITQVFENIKPGNHYTAVADREALYSCP
jgi:tetratricopeptide (TPR) repeat protein